jgi:hypothetical protein
VNWPPPTRTDRAAALDRAQHRCEQTGPAGRPCTGSSSGLTLVRVDPAQGPTLPNLKAMCHACATAHNAAHGPPASAPPAATPDTEPLF